MGMRRAGACGGRGGRRRPQKGRLGRQVLRPQRHPDLGQQVPTGHQRELGFARVPERDVPRLHHPAPQMDLARGGAAAVRRPRAGAGRPSQRHSLHQRLPDERAVPEAAGPQPVLPGLRLCDVLSGGPRADQRRAGEQVLRLGGRLLGHERQLRAVPGRRLCAGLGPQQDAGRRLPRVQRRPRSGGPPAGGAAARQRQPAAERHWTGAGPRQLLPGAHPGARRGRLPQRHHLPALPGGRGAARPVPEAHHLPDRAGGQRHFPGGHPGRRLPAALQPPRPALALPDQSRGLSAGGRRSAVHHPDSRRSLSLLALLSHRCGHALRVPGRLLLAEHHVLQHLVDLPLKLTQKPEYGIAIAIHPLLKLTQKAEYGMGIAIHPL
ncbi:hypothetical protein YQE_11073, partial [Dendroctonus ponderosae]